MISVDEALALVLQQARTFYTESVPLLPATGRILATNILADRDLPPFNRVTMDGIAINEKSFNNGCRQFRIEGIQAAGVPAKQLSNPEHCLEVMTGAVLPGNADVVIPYEQCEIRDGVARVKCDNVRQYQNVHLAGTDSRNGDTVLLKGTKITAAVTSLLATTGHAEVEVTKLCRVVICSTGDELVSIEQEPEPYQIRRSNSYFLAAALLAEGVDVTIDHLIDDDQTMLTQVSKLLAQHDVLLFSGAVSRGRFDYLPKVLVDLGMKTVFHQVAQKPGKPFLFGHFEEGPVVFAFPGNPLSTMVCYYHYFKPWLHACIGQHEEANLVSLGEDVLFKPALTYHLPATIVNERGLLIAYPLRGSGSGDVITITKANGIVTLPATRERFMKGEIFPVTLL